MQGVRFQRLARSLGGDLVEQARAKEVDDDRGHHHPERPERRLDRVAVPAEQALQRLPDHDAGEQEQQRSLGQRRHAFDLAVAVVVLLVGGLAGNAHREIGHHRRDQIEQRMGGFRQDCERAGGEADHGLGHGQAPRRRDRGQRHPLFDVRHDVPLRPDR